jgi:type IV pilus assembly protein PilB
VEDLTFALDRDVRIVVADPPAVAALIRRHYGEDRTSSAALLEEIAPEDCNGHGHELSVTELTQLADQTPVVRLVNGMLAQAICDRASDIHFEPFEDELRVRYRLDGALHDLAPSARHLALPVISRLKVLANLNIAERRVPQDGRIRLTQAGRAVDLRVSTLPTQHGESVVLRILDQGALDLDIAQLGLPANVRTGMEEVIRRPNGIFLVTGPTGSGKTTTLYSGLRAINSTELKILTAEDPVEYEIEGVMQLPVNPAIGLTFAAALRAFLRQDPDVVMVGEIRDPETAQVAIQAALTGHLVLSTLHTNDAVGAVTRLTEMGVEPFLLAATLEAVLAQRLVRRLCRDCQVSYAPAGADLQQVGLDCGTLAGRPFFKPHGCAQCNHTGYHGRMGLFEWLRLTEPLRELVLQPAPTRRIQQLAVAQGMQTLREHGVARLLDGETSLEEVIRHT